MRHVKRQAKKNRWALVVLVIVAGVFLAVSPRVYRDGMIVLLPPERWRSFL